MATKRSQSHLTEEELIRLLDGELDRRSREAIAAHLEECWTCRHQVEVIRRSMDRFVEYEKVLFASPEIATDRWQAFPEKLRTAARQAPPAASSRRVRSGAIALGVVAGVTTVAWLWPAPTASAHEILHRSSVSEKAVIGRVDNPIVEQRVRVESGPRRAEGLFWSAPYERRRRHQWMPAGDQALRAELEILYSRQGLSLDQPISVANYAKWRQSQPHVQDAVEEEGGYLRIKSRAAGTIGSGGITEAQLLVRASDLHPVEQSFAVVQENATRRYRVVETSYRVEPLRIDTVRLLEPPPASSAPTVVVSPVITPVPVPAPVIIPVPPAPAAQDTRVLIETEITVLALLHDMGADSRDGAIVKRESSAVRVTLYPEDAQREAQLTATLQEMPHVIATIHPLSAAPAEPATAASIPAAVGSPPADPVSPLFLTELARAVGSLRAANLLVSRELQLLSALRIEAAAHYDLSVRFPEALRDELSAPVRDRLDHLILSRANAMRSLWQEAILVGDPMMSVMGISPIGQSASAPCSRLLSDRDLMVTSRRIEELYSRAFSSLAGGDVDLRNISKTSLRGEIQAMRISLLEALQEGCRQ